MLAIAAFYNYEIWQMDVKIVFLNGFLEEELYMMQSEGFVDPKGDNKFASSAVHLWTRASTLELE